MSDKSVTGDDEIDLALITLALMESNFDLDKVVKRFKGLGEKRRIRDVLAQAEVRIRGPVRVDDNKFGRELAAEQTFLNRGRKLYKARCPTVPSSVCAESPGFSPDWGFS